MKTELWYIGKTSFPYLKEGMAIYDKRLRHYLPFEQVCFPDVKNAKNLSINQLKEQEADIILKKLRKDDWLVLLDENGKAFTSRQMAEWLQKQLQLSYKRIIFLIGGAYGFSPKVYERSNTKISLSQMTFSHQMVRLFFLEQLYRSMTILRNEPYHH